MTRKTSFVFGVSAALFLAVSAAQALTFKKGQVQGADGKVYDGASPEQQENIVEASKGTDWFGNKKTAGVVGSNVYIVVEDNTVFVPISDLRGKDKEAVADLIKERLVESLTANMMKAYTDEEGFDQEAFDEDFANMDVANDQFTNEMAQEIADVAAKDVERAQALLDATLDLAAIDAAADEAAISAAEEAYEQAHQAAMRAVEGISDEMNELLNDPDSVFDADGNYLGSFEEMCSAGEISGC